MVGEVTAVGAVLLVFGLPGAVWPERVATFEEQLDSIGSRRSWSEVEPTDWKVGFTRASGILMTVIGALWVVGG